MFTYFIVIAMAIFWGYLAQRCCKMRKNLHGDGYGVYKTIDAKFCLFVAGAILVITAGCRYRVGTDYKSYMELYKTYVATDLKELFTLEEPVLPIIGNLCGKFFDSYKAMFFIASLLTVGLAVYSMYKETTDFMFVTLIYIFVGCWHGTFNGIRQYLAVTVLFLGRQFIFERKFLKYAMVCFLAFLCHRSSIVFILLYFIYSKKFTTGRIIAVVVASVVISANYSVIFEMIGWLNDSEFIITEYTSTAVNFLRVAVGCAPAILALYYAYTKQLDETQKFYVYMLVANAAVRLSTSESAYLARLGAYTGIFVPLGLASLLKKNSGKITKVLRVFIILMYLIYWMYEMTNSATLREFEWFFGK